MKKSLIAALLCLTTISALSQKVTIETDTTVTDEKARMATDGGEIKEIDTYADRFVPRKASLYSAVLPGLGQIYNKRYWKVPIIYGGFIALGLVVDFYNDEYKFYRAELFTLLEEGESPLGLSETQLRNVVDDTRRERDFYMILTGVLYLLQVAEAHIDAHLKEFKLNPDLQVSIEPNVEPPTFANFNQYNTGISLVFKF